MKISPQLAQYRRRREEFIDLLGGVCVDCGSTHQLEFDHDDRILKSFDVSKSYSKNYEDLKKEILKCKLRCKKCHKRKTQDVDGLKAEHGKYSMYRHHKCRCELCKEANREQHKSWRQKRRAVA